MSPSGFGHPLLNQARWGHRSPPFCSPPAGASAVGQSLLIAAYFSPAMSGPSTNRGGDEPEPLSQDFTVGEIHQRSIFPRPISPLVLFKPLSNAARSAGRLPSAGARAPRRGLFA